MARFSLDLVASARDDLRFFQKFEQQLILDAIERQLSTEPLIPTRNRKLLRPNRLATWELRVDRYRIFYNVEIDNGVVSVKAIGWKEHNTLFIRGKEYVL